MLKKEKNRGITLIALVVTVIVLLILAAVSIQMLTGDNGIITNASKVSTSNAYYSAEEQVKLAYMAVKAEISAKTVKSGTYNPAESAETTALATIVANDLGANQTGSKWAVDGSTAGTIKITYTDSKIDKDSIGTVNLETLEGTTVPTVVPREEGAVHYKIKLLPSQDAKLYLDISNDIEGVNFGTEKTKSTVTKGDTIEITFTEGNETYVEQFMVLSNDTNNGKIMAMPYYNLVLETGRQATEENASSAGTVAFSYSNYWINGGINIPMSGANNVQQYITAYNTKLSNATGGAVTAQIGRNVNGTAEADWNISGFNGQSNSETPAKKLLNPSGVDSFWLGSSYSGNANFMHYVYTNGLITTASYSGSSSFGVRPVIKITY